MSLYTVSSGTALQPQDLNQLYNLLTGNDPSTAVTVKNRIQAFTPGAMFPAGYVGGTSGGPPSTGTFQVGDFVVDSALGCLWVCSVGGSPGTWYRNGAADYACVAVSTAAQTLIARSGQTGFDTVALNGLQDPNADPHGMFSASGHSITASHTGYHIVTGAFGTTLASTTFSQAAVLIKNGSIVSRGDEYRVINGGNTTVADVIHLNAGDAVTLGAYAEAGASINTGSGQNVLSMCLIT